MHVVARIGNMVPNLGQCVALALDKPILDDLHKSLLDGITKNLLESQKSKTHHVEDALAILYINSLHLLVCLFVFYLSLTSFDSWPLFLWYPLSSSFSQFFFLSVRSFFFSDVISLRLSVSDTFDN